MFPQIQLFGALDIYVFGIFIVAAWATFFGLLHHFSIQKWLIKHIFSDVVSYTVSIFLMSRLFYIIGEWRDEKFIFMNLIEGKGFLNFLQELFAAGEYNLSLAGGIIGFALIYFIKGRKAPKNDTHKYIDSLAYAFLIAAMIGYIGALFWGQIYGVPAETWISIVYNDKNSIVPFRNPLLPLPIMYWIWCGLIFLFLYRFGETKNVPHGWIGYMGIGLYAVLVFLGEFMNGSSDMFSSSGLHLNLNQLTSLILLGYSLTWLSKLMKF